MLIRPDDLSDEAAVKAEAARAKAEAATEASRDKPLA